MNRWERRNPRADLVLRQEVLELARAFAREEARKGALAVLLAGSWARGDARAGSDVDLWVLGKRSRHDVFSRGGHILSVARRTVPGVLRALREPPYGGQARAAWRYAITLWDPKGAARRVRTEALRPWDPAFRPKWDRYVARSFVEWGEEVVKLTRAMGEGLPETAAVQRNLLVDALALLVAARDRLRYDQNHLWELAGRRMGPDWHRLQLRALAAGGEGLEASCEAALDLYFSTARAFRDLLTPNQREVLGLVARAAGRDPWDLPISRRARRRPEGRRGRGASGGSSTASRRARPG